MSARRCALCGINYPAIAQFQTCPIHDEPTTLAQNVEPDSNWKDAFARLQKQIEAAAELQRPIPLVRGVSVVEEGGLLFVSQPELWRAGARLSRFGAGFYLFELEDGWVYETQGFDDPRRRWWVERVIRSEEEASQPTTSADEPSSTASATS